MNRVPVTVRLGPDTLAALETRLALRGGTRAGRLAEVLAELSAFAEGAARLTREAFDELTAALAGLLPELGLSSHRVRPPALTLSSRSRSGPEEPLELEWPLALGLGVILSRAGVRSDLPLEVALFGGGGLLSQWGQAVGRALGFDGMLSLALGEFCRAWVYGVSCRSGHLDLLVAELEQAFATGLAASVTVGDGTARRLFPAGTEDREVYRRAWRAVFAVLEGVRDGRFAVRAEGDLRLRDGSGRPAAVVVLEGAAR